MQKLRPMLAAKDAGKIKFPVLVSPKLDGIRALVKDGVVLSRSLKPIPNVLVQYLFGRDELEGFDGELIVGEPTGNEVYRRTNSGVMSVEGEPAVRFFAFDLWNEDLPYTARYKMLVERWKAYHLECADMHKADSFVTPLQNAVVREAAQLDAAEADALAAGFEGLMVRDPNGAYKYGRATAKGGELVKIKRFEDGEATIVGFEERMHNGNEATTNELGRSQRSTHQANKTGRGDLGAFICNITVGNGKVCFNVGTGMSDQERATFWENRERLVNQVIKFKHFAVSGVKDAPRHPVFLGFRDQLDMSDSQVLGGPYGEHPYIDEAEG